MLRHDWRRSAPFLEKEFGSSTVEPQLLHRSPEAAPVWLNVVHLQPREPRSRVELAHSLSAPSS